MLSTKLLNPKINLPQQDKMSRRKKKKIPHAGRSVSVEKRTQHVPTALLVSIILTLILGGIPFGMGKYIELNSPGPFDSGAYVYSAKHLLSGARMGVDEKSSARPGTLLVNIIGVKLFGFNDIGPKIVQMILQLAALIFMFITMRKVFGSVAGVVGTTIAAVYLSAPLIAKFGNVKEQFMIPFMILSICSFLWYEFTHNKYWIILSGFFALLPYYFKPTGLSILCALFVYLFVSRIISRTFKTLLIELLLFLCGYVSGLILPGSLFLWQKDLGSLFTSLPVIAIQAGLFFTCILAILIGIVSAIRRFKLITQFHQVSGWIWAAGLLLIVIAFAAAAFMIKIEPGSSNDDIISYILNIPLVASVRKLFFLIYAQINKLIASAGGGEYIADSLAARGLSKLAPQVFRYYRALSVPILAALCSILIATGVWIRAGLKKSPRQDIQSRLAWMLAIWWVLDMAFVWISPRSYEQYYLPLCGSAAVLSGYAVWTWQKQFMLSQNRMPWLAGGVAAAITLGCLSIPIFIGQRYSPDTGADYLENPRYGQRQRGFGPALKELPGRKQGLWIAAGDYIRTHSTEKDMIYVWGWYPGIYVQAQRLAPVPKAFESNMHVTPPNKLKHQINALVNALKEHPPKFIVDTRKRHFPNDRPPLELWPIVPSKMLGNERGRLLSTNPQEIATYDAAWKQILKTKFEPDEAERYEAMQPFREFVMNHYKISSQFGPQIVFERKN